MNSGRNADAVSDVLSTILLVVITVVVAAGFALLLLQLPAPADRAPATMEAFVLPTANTVLVIEHQGGVEIPISDLKVQTVIGSSTATVNVGTCITTPSSCTGTWAVVSSAGSSKASTGTFTPGDQVRHTNTAIPGSTVTASVVHEGKNVVLFGSATVQTGDTTRPTLTAASVIQSTVVQVTFNEAMGSIAAADFTVATIAPTSARLIGDGTLGELTMAAAVATTTPTVTTIASPTATQDLQNNLVNGGASLSATDGLGTSNIQVHVIYSGEQDRNDATMIGISIVNPTLIARSVSAIGFSVSPTLGTGSSSFFRTTFTNLPGSDFSCSWGSTGNSITCTPGTAVTLPANGVLQGGLSFTTSDSTSDANTVLTGTVTLAGPSGSLTTTRNVRHESDNDKGLTARLMGEDSLAGSERAGFSVAGGGARDFYFEWRHAGSDASLTTRFIIPAGWSSVSVPTGSGQGTISQMAISIRQPTATTAGYVDVGQVFEDTTARDFFFRATVPSGASATTLQVEMTQIEQGNDGHMVMDLLEFGVRIT